MASLLSLVKFHASSEAVIFNRSTHSADARNLINLHCVSGRSTSMKSARPSEISSVPFRAGRSYLLLKPHEYERAVSTVRAAKKFCQTPFFVLHNPFTMTSHHLPFPRYLLFTIYDLPSSSPTRSTASRLLPQAPSDSERVARLIESRLFFAQRAKVFVGSCTISRCARYEMFVTRISGNR